MPRTPPALVDSFVRPPHNQIVKFIKTLEGAAAPFFLDHQAPRKIVLGAVLSLLPVVSFFSLGYVLAILERSLQGSGDEELPEWRRPEDLFIRGVIFFLVILTYSAPPYLLTSAAFAMLRMGFVFLPPAIITLAAGAALWVAAIFFTPMAMVLFLRKKSADAVFQAAAIYQQTSLVLNPYIQATILNLALLAVISLPALVKPAGYFLSSPVLFVAMTFMAGVYGRTCRTASPAAEERAAG